MTTASSCPNVLANGSCADRGCRYIHTMLPCEPCGFLFNSTDAYASHLESNAHHARIIGQTVTQYCPLCEANVTGQRGWKEHTQGRSHQRKAVSTGVPADVAPQPPVATASAMACDLCQIVLPTHIWNTHLTSAKHKSRELFSRYMTAVEQSEADKNGVVVEGLFDFDFIDSAVAQVGKQMSATVKALQPSSNCVLLEAKLASAQGKGGGVSS